MKIRLKALAALTLVFATLTVAAQDPILTLDRIYSGEFRQDYEESIQWIDDGDSYVIVERTEEGTQLMKYKSATQEGSVFVPTQALQAEDGPLRVESFTLSPDGSKVLIFTNSKRVWRSNTKGDYWVYDLTTSQLKQLGASLAPSSLMFAKFSSDNTQVYYVHEFNIYREDFASGTIDQLTTDGSVDIINGTFDWVYEEEFGKRDGFMVNSANDRLAFWQLDASSIGTFYMINNTDSIYSKLIPVQYPKVGQDPSSARIGMINLVDGQISWVPLEGDPVQNYIPGMQWVNSDLLLIQQMNRHQNELKVWAYTPSDNSMRLVYTETEDTWVDLGYPDISANNWGNNDLPIVDGGKAFLRMTENDAWRHVYKVNIASGKKTLITPSEYDVASTRAVTSKYLYYMASPDNPTQRYLYRADLKGKGRMERITPQAYSGINNYDMAPNGKYAVHIHQSSTEVRTVRFVSLPDHRTIWTVVDNEAYAQKLSTLAMPEVRWTKVTTEDGIDVEVRMLLPHDFDSTKTYPVLFYVYGEPWGQVAVDGQTSLTNAMYTQLGYVLISMDNRGTPCLKGSEWRKSIYRKIGQINVRDQAMAAKEVLKLPYLDNDRVAVWGWSGGGSMTLNLLFQYPEIYQTGIAVAAVSNQLIYDNIYQERYMGLPQENEEDFIAGSPITYAKNLEGNLLVIHGTADDNVHYQSAEMLINELVKQNKAFDLMVYPNRSHGIYEGPGTRRHLDELLLRYLTEHTPVN
ncbi:DPP IV N-terminal domain-containing protein [Cryomorphaceae bacterium]|nr:DPP IV N-terminal domain-containing protein [Cryomorphaceae bacterium]